MLEGAGAFFGGGLTGEGGKEARGPGPCEHCSNASPAQDGLAPQLRPCAPPSCHPSPTARPSATPTPRPPPPSGPHPPSCQLEAHKAQHRQQLEQIEGRLQAVVAKKDSAIEALKAELQVGRGGGGNWGSRTSQEGWRGGWVKAAPRCTQAPQSALAAIAAFAS